MTPDERRLGAIATGDHAAFEEIFETHVDFVFNVALRRTGSMAEADDIVAEVFGQLWKQRTSIATRYGSLRPWLAGVATNLARRHWRSAERRERAVQRLSSRSEMVGEDIADQSARQLDAVHRLERVRAALEELPTEQHIVLTLSVWEEFSHHEIAEALNIAVGTVKSRLSRARAALEHSVGTEPADGALAQDRHMEAVSGQSAIQHQGEQP